MLSEALPERLLSCYELRWRCPTACVRDWLQRTPQYALNLKKEKKKKMIPMHLTDHLLSCL